MSGYDIKHTVQNSTQHFWNESYGNLYPTLQKLVAKKYIQISKQATSGRARIEYSLTELGKKHLLAWIHQPASPTIIRDELLLKVFFGKHADKKHLLAQFNKEAESIQEKIVALNNIANELSKKHVGNKHLPFWLLTVRCGLKEYQARLEWCEESIKIINNL